MSGKKRIYHIFLSCIVLYLFIFTSCILNPPSVGGGGSNNNNTPVVNPTTNVWPDVRDLKIWDSLDGLSIYFDYNYSDISKIKIDHIALSCIKESDKSRVNFQNVKQKVFSNRIDLHFNELIFDKEEALTFSVKDKKKSKSITINSLYVSGSKIEGVRVREGENWKYDLSFTDNSVEENAIYDVFVSPAFSLISPYKLCSFTKDTNTSSFSFYTPFTQSFNVQLRKRSGNKCTPLSDKVTASFTKKDVDTLCLMYMDGDNNLNDAIWEDYNEGEEGLKKLKGNTKKCEVITLFDGSSFGDSYLILMGEDDRNNTLGKNSIDLSSTASFFTSFRDKNGKVQREVNMCDKETVTSYYDWAIKHYNITQDTKIILQFSNHGGGPIVIGYPGRLICQDENLVSNTYPYLLSYEVPQAIKETFGKPLGLNRKVDLVIQDVCLGSSIEEIYEYKDVCNYMLLSPNNMPGLGLNYVDVIGQLDESSTSYVNGELDIQKYNQNIIDNFKEFYKPYVNAISGSSWNKMRESAKRKNPKASGEELDILTSYEYKASPTLTSIKVDGVVALKDNFSSLVDYLYKETDTFKINNKVGSYKDLLNDFVFTPLFNTISYETPLEDRLYDIGELLDNLERVNELNEHVTEKEKVSSLILAVRKNLDNVIISSYREGYNGALYEKRLDNKKNGMGKYKNNSYGIGILGFNEKYYFDASRYYNDYVSFGKAVPLWKQLVLDISRG